jgi:hypothetical protein
MLVKWKEHGALLEAIDLRTCIETERFTRALRLSETCKFPRKPQRLGCHRVSIGGLEGRVGPFDEEEERTDDEKY